MDGRRSDGHLLMSRQDPDKLSAQLSAYLDGELGERERQSIERTLARDPAARALLTELRQTVQLMHELPRRHAPESLLPELTAVIERRQLLDASDQSERSRPGRRRVLYSMLAMAAAVALLVTGGLWVLNLAGQRNAPSGGALGPVAVRSEKNESALGISQAPPPLDDFADKLGQPLERAQDSKLFIRDEVGKESRSSADEVLRAKAAMPAQSAAHPSAPPAVPARNAPGEAAAGIMAVTEEQRPGGAAEQSLGAALVMKKQLGDQPAAGESIVLNASFNDAVERDASAARIENLLSARQYPPASGPVAGDRVASPAGRAAGFGAQAGRVQVVSAQQSGYILSVPTSQLTETLGLVAGAAGQAPEVELACGPFVARGPAEIQTLIQFTRADGTKAREPVRSGKGGGEDELRWQGVSAGLERFVQHLRTLMQPGASDDRRARRELEVDTSTEPTPESMPAAEESRKVEETPATQEARDEVDRRITLFINLLVSAPATQEAPVTDPAATTQTAPADAP
jgi:hypothetical protein